MYQFRLSIGDWSGDSHGLHEDFLITSNAPVERVREAHYQIKEITGINIEDICSNYEEDEIPDEEVELLQKLGFEFEDSTGMGPGITNVAEMASLWLFLLQKADPALELTIADENVPTLHFCGFDDKKRHIGFVGYGLFHRFGGLPYVRKIFYARRWADLHQPQRSELPLYGQRGLCR